MLLGGRINQFAVTSFALFWALLSKSALKRGTIISLYVETQLLDITTLLGLSQ